MQLMIIFSACFLTEQSVLTTKLNIKLETPITITPTTKQNNVIDFQHHIFSETKKILIKHDHATLINKFSLHRNFIYNCHELYLPIELIVKAKKEEEEVKLILTAYLDSFKNELIEHQNYSHVCTKIRR